MGSNLDETIRNIRHKKTGAPISLASHEPITGQHATYDFRGLLGRVYQTHSRPKKFGNGFFQKWIMCTAKYECIDPTMFETAEIQRNRCLCDLVINPSLFNEGNKQGTGSRID